MTIQQTVYSILSAANDLTGIVGGNIFPDVPTTDTQLPFVVYWVQSSEPTNTLDGQVRPTNYTVSIETWAVTISTVAAVLDAVRVALNGYRDDAVQGAFLQSENTTAEETGYHGQATYSIWA